MVRDDPAGHSHLIERRNGDESEKLDREEGLDRCVGRGYGGSPGGGIFAVERAYAKEAKEIDASVDVALDRFFKDVKGAKEFANTAKGMLVMPGVKKAAYGVGGEYGEGALRVKGQSVAYYNFFAASYGWQIGAQAKDMVVAFMTDEALKRFQGSKDCEGGSTGTLP